MRKLLYITILALTVGLSACSRSARQKQILVEAERIAAMYPDSALALVSDIDAQDLKDADNKALYATVIATVNNVKESSMAGDSLIRFAYNFYRGNDKERFLRSGNLYAMHLFWMGEGMASLAVLDSLLATPNLPDSIEIELLQTRTGIGGSLFDCKRNICYIKRLQKLDNNTEAQLDYKYQLCENYQFAGQSDSALTLIDELIEYAKVHQLAEDQFKFTYEKVGILEEKGRYAESNALVDYIWSHAPDYSSNSFLHYWKALNYFNLGDFKNSQHHLAIADSSAITSTDIDRDYYESFARPLREYLAYKQSGVIKLTQLAFANNLQQHKSNRIETNRRQAEQNSLMVENRALELKAENQRKTAIIIIVILIAVIITIIALWNIQKRRRRVVEAEERVDALNKMVEELKHPTPTSAHDALRRAMLQQLGIIKMVAETPTEQNREMLRKISSMENEATGGALVNWDNVYEIVDNLYSDFCKKLHNRYGGILTEKEEQVIVLFVAGFSAKEISVITSQSTASIYVRKSAVKKKLGVAEKEDVVDFLKQELTR
ncbi:MAG: LuxR C-terminal-related transcriptional regulator [Bacteroidales bacterium]|nr:LuxR C-terminal-related transcriptional regulator [Bacteroidales bacterium]